MIDKCFVLMPFGDPYDSYYSGIIMPAIREAGYIPFRADEIYGTKPIIADIFESIRESAVLVAEATSKNPNVNYELGIAHALDKPVVIISQSIDDIPFDYKHRRVIIYDTKKVKWVTELQSSITNTLRSTEPSSTPSITALPVRNIHIDTVDVKRDGCHIKARLTGNVTPRVADVRVWLLREDVSGSAGKYSVGGTPTLTDRNGDWQQFTYLWEAERFRIHAVVTDPDSEKLFKYFRSAFQKAREVYRQKVDPESDSFPGWPSLEDIPLNLVRDSKEVIL